MNKERFSWSCVFFAQIRQAPYLVKIGVSKNPKQRVSTFSSEIDADVTLIWYMRAHQPLGKRIVHEAFSDLRCRLNGDLFMSDARLRGFVMDCKANQQRILTPEVIENVLPKYTDRASMYADEAAAYRTIFDAEYKYLKSVYAKPARPLTEDDRGADVVADSITRRNPLLDRLLKTGKMTSHDVR